MIGERPFYFVGANLNVMHQVEARQRYAATISAAAADGLTVGRVWALGEGLPEDPDWKARDYLFRTGPTGWREEAFVQLDRVVAEAGKKGLRLVVTLSNRWSDYGGIPMYLRWAGHQDVEAYGYSDRFFEDARCRAWFKEHLRRVVGRRNSVTGVPYRDDPTILAWELQNEMNGTPEAAGARRAWIVEMSRFVRAIDANHLVVPGLIGYNLQQDRREWIAINRLPEVAFCDQHSYPEEHLRSRGAKNLVRYVDDRVQLAHHVIGKPIVFGEFGFDGGATAARRAAWHHRFLERIFYNGGNGALVWIYQPTLNWKRTYPVLIDDRRHGPLRRTLREWARRVQAGEVVGRNPRLGAAQGDRPLAPTHAMLRRAGAPAAGWRPVVRGARRLGLAIPAERFAVAWFEEAGSWDGGVLVHAYGRQTGWIEYRFVGPGFVPREFRIRARLSSEYPGRWGPPHGYSRVRVHLDGRPVGDLRVAPDDGEGRWYEVSVSDAALLRRLRGGVHRLRFEVPAGPEANGVAIYGAESPLNREPVEAPGPITLEAGRGETVSAPRRAKGSGAEAAPGKGAR
ncbi:MAG: cellulase family glycosylhydrolase [Deltaproteobacteria bacterium]|nr:cellulase family glycosylhydrolase [Deltaproteobacteria bacterium]